jgi:hypothetical protein
MRMAYPNLTWEKASWPDQTYQARLGEWSFTIDYVGPEWRLRGWHSKEFSACRYARTAAELQQWADDNVQ